MCVLNGRFDNDDDNLGGCQQRNVAGLIYLGTGTDLLIWTRVGSVKRFSYGTIINVIITGVRK